MLSLSMCVLLLAGCGSTSSSGNESGGSIPGKETGKNNDKNSSLINKDVIYKSTPLNMELPMYDIGYLVVSGDVMYIGGYVYDEETWASTYYLYSCGLDGSDLKVIYTYSENEEKYGVAFTAEVATEVAAEAATEGTAEGIAEEITEETTEGENSDVTTGQYIQNMAGDGQGNLVELISIWTSSPDDYTTEMCLKKIDRDGNELWTAELKDDAYATSFSCGGDRIVVNCSNVLYVFDGSGAPVSQVELTGDFWINSMVVLDDGSIYVTYYDFSGETGRYVLAPVDLQTGKLGEMIETSWVSQGFSLRQGIGYDIFLQNSSIVAGYNVGDEDYTEILNFVDSDIDAGNMSFLYPSGEGRFIAGIYDTDTREIEMYELTKVDPADVKDKIVLTLGMMYNDYQMTSQVIEFNKTNEDYRIKLVVYNTYNTDANPEGGITQLNNDITSGKMPDILITNSYYMPLNSYIGKGAFEDLYTWLDSDAELNREDYMPNVLEAFTVDGKLYQITPSFSINTVAGKSSIVGDTAGWTIDDVLALAERYPDSELFDMMTREEMLINWMSRVGYQFIDELAGTCSFDSEDFIKLLEWISTFPEEIDYSKMDDKYWMEYDSQWREDRVLLQTTYLSNFSDFKYMRTVTFGEKVTYIGYPVSERTGAILQLNNTFAMSSQSKNKEGAWQFIRYFLTDEYQTSNNLWDFPAKISALQQAGAEAMKPYTYLDENGNEVEMEDTYWVGDKEVTAEPLTQEEIDGYIEYMKTVNKVYSLNTDILNIITEDTAIYFAGQKSAAEVAKIIQSRANIFLAENS